MSQPYDTTLKALIAEHFLSLLSWLRPEGSSYEYGMQVDDKGRRMLVPLANE